VVGCSWRRCATLVVVRLLSEGSGLFVVAMKGVCTFVTGKVGSCYVAMALLGSDAG